MKTVLDLTTRQELVNRIELVSINTKPLWGKMNTYQMFKHCSIAEEMYLGKMSYPQTFLGKVIGARVLKSILKNDSQLGRHAKTLKPFIVIDNGDAELQRERWIRLLAEYEDYSLPFLTHWFFGMMTKEEVGFFSYKHADHHLRQFGC